MFESEPGRISDELMDNSYFTTRGRPNEGMRLVWLPKDEDDLSFFDTNFKITDADAANNGLIDIADMSLGAANLLVQTYQGTTWIDSGAVDRVIAPYQVYGHGAKKLQSTHPDMLGIAWQGLPANQTWIRIDVERHFEAIPRTAVRDIMSTAKSKPSTRTMEVVKKVADIPAIMSQTIADSKLLENNVKPNLVEIADNLAPSGGGSWTDSLWTVGKAALNAGASTVGTYIGGPLLGATVSGLVGLATANSNTTNSGNTSNNQAYKQGMVTQTPTPNPGPMAMQMAYDQYNSGGGSGLKYATF